MNTKEWIQIMGADKVIKGFDFTIKPEFIENFKEDIIPTQIEQRNDKTIMFNFSSAKDLHPSDYLLSISPYLQKAIISSQNLMDMQDLTNNFTKNLTSFLIFESRLKSHDARSDYCFAVSSNNREREVLKELLKDGNLHHDFLKQSEWKQLREFVDFWADPKSILNDNIIGLWFEFDTASNISNTPAPSIFIQPKSKYMISGEVSAQHTWFTKTALPLLLGRPLSNNVEEKVLDCIKKLPLESSVFQIGTMLSRKDDEIRLVIKRITADQIIPYLNSIGWVDDENDRLSILLDEVKDKVTRIVLHISVGEKVNPKVGIECSFYPNKYHQENGWANFLDYLLEKGLCNKEKYSALLNFSGIEPQHHDENFNPELYRPAVMIPEEEYSSALIRFISHIKLIYQPTKTTQAKAYPAVRLFGHPYETPNHTSRLIKNR